MSAVVSLAVERRERPRPPAAAPAVRPRAAVVAVGNLKGGVGKSTLSVNLAAMLGAIGRPSAVIDADPQQTACRWLRGRRLPCAVLGHPVGDGTRGAPDDADSWLQTLARARERFDVVVVDLPAVLSPVLVGAFLTADIILVPTTSSPVDLESTHRTLRRVRAVLAERADRPPAVMVVPMRVPRSWLGRLRVPASLGQLHVRLGPAIGDDPAYHAAFTRGDWVGGEPGHSLARREIASLADAVAGVLDARKDP